VRTNPSLLGILFVQLVVHFPTFYRDSIKPRRRKRFDWICRLQMDPSNSEIHKIANVGNGQATREAYQRPFSEHPEASFVRHIGQL
jgi:hypothetical protein